MSEKILVPLDGRTKSTDALEYAIEHHPEAEITVLHALDLRAIDNIPGIAVALDEPAEDVLAENAERIFEEAKEIADSLGYEREIQTISEEGDPEQVILDHAEDFDGIVMGTHGRDGRKLNLLGSVAETVVRRSPVPVTIAK